MDAFSQMFSSLPSILFFFVGAVAVASAIMVVAMRNPVHSALFLLLTFLCVATIFIIARAEFVGAVQILVYAGGIMVLFLFVVMLINVRELPKERRVTSAWVGGVAMGALLFGLFASMVWSGKYLPALDDPVALQTAPAFGARTPQTAADRVVGNSEALGMMLYSDYLVPFEVVSLFLLVAMIGAIVIGKRELESMDEDASPKFISDRVETEKRIKEAAGA
jgi:NADH:ubiquinone oxidoreductase subunit 6 (chain J)